MCGGAINFKSYQMELNDRIFIEQNIINFETVGLGYTRNIDHGILEGYELIYRKYLDKHFILTRWCGSCVFEMIQRLKVYYEALPKVEEPKSKRGRPKK